MVITGISPVVTTYLTVKLIEEIGKNVGNNSSTVYLKLLIILFSMIVLIVISFATESVKTIICSVAGLELAHNIEKVDNHTDVFVGGFFVGMGEEYLL